MFRRNNLILASCWFLAWLILWTWRWRQHIPPMRRLTFNGLHEFISQKIQLFKRELHLGIKYWDSGAPAECNYVLVGTVNNCHPVSYRIYNSVCVQTPRCQTYTPAKQPSITIETASNQKAVMTDCWRTVTEPSGRCAVASLQYVW
jgi:hypothetical protein